MQLVKQSPWQRFRPWVITAVVVLIFAWAFSGIPLASVKPQALIITKAIFHGLFQPDWSYVYTVAYSIRIGHMFIRGMAKIW